MKELYDIAVNPCKISEIYNDISELEMQQIKFELNSDAVRSLISFK